MEFIEIRIKLVKHSCCKMEDNITTAWSGVISFFCLGAVASIYRTATGSQTREFPLACFLRVVGLTHSCFNSEMESWTILVARNANHPLNAACHCGKDEVTVDDVQTTNSKKYEVETGLKTRNPG